MRYLTEHRSAGTSWQAIAYSNQDGDPFESHEIKTNPRISLRLLIRVADETMDPSSTYRFFDTSAARSLALGALLAAFSAPSAFGADDGAALARLRGAISEAVQSVAEMPMAARLQRRAGRAQVGFAYQDGTVADATLLQSSRSRLLDQAALTAVMRARYPAPPAPLRGRRLSLQVWVDFTMVPQAPI